MTIDRPLLGKVAVVTGSSRGIGRGIAVVLGERGATVYVTGRSAAAGPLPGTVHDAAEEVTRRGGLGIPIVCDHANDDEVRELFSRVERDSGRLDLLVNNVFAVPDMKLFGAPFWEQPVSMWDTLLGVGLRSHYVASVCAAPIMVRQKSGLIVNVSSVGGGRYAFSVAYGVGKCAVDRLARDMARDLKKHSVAAVSIWPGIVRTERMLAMRDELPFGFDDSESPELSGRAVAAMLQDPLIMSKTGKVMTVADLAAEYGFVDIDGRTPTPLRVRPENPK